MRGAYLPAEAREKVYFRWVLSSSGRKLNDASVEFYEACAEETEAHRSAASGHVLFASDGVRAGCAISLRCALNEADFAALEHFEGAHMRSQRLFEGLSLGYIY